MSTFKERIDEFDTGNLHFAEEDAKLLSGLMLAFGLLVVSKILKRKRRKK
jgi:hypothetical protein